MQIKKSVATAIQTWCTCTCCWHNYYFPNDNIMCSNNLLPNDKSMCSNNLLPNDKSMCSNNLCSPCYYKTCLHLSPTHNTFSQYYCVSPTLVAILLETDSISETKYLLVLNTLFLHRYRMHDASVTMLVQTHLREDYLEVCMHWLQRLRQREREGGCDVLQHVSIVRQKRGGDQGKREEEIRARGGNQGKRRKSGQEEEIRAKERRKSGQKRGGNQGKRRKSGQEEEIRARGGNQGKREEEIRAKERRRSGQKRGGNQGKRRKSGQKRGGNQGKREEEMCHCCLLAYRLALSWYQSRLWSVCATICNGEWRPRSFKLVPNCSVKWNNMDVKFERNWFINI